VLFGCSGQPSQEAIIKTLRHLVAILSLGLFVCPELLARKERGHAPKCDEKIQLPNAALAALKKAPDVAVSCRLKPSLIEGDFDGDGKPDYAVLVTQREQNNRGFLIAFGNGQRVVAGAGRAVKYGPAAASDLNFDQWELYRKSRPVESTERQEPLKLKGDALLVRYHEGASGLYYWDGKRVHWYQQGD
jgi:hypothetical protein